MARCLNCLKTCTGMCCSLECANERMALMLEGVELLDSLLAMVDKAAEERAVRAVAQTAPVPAQRRPSARANVVETQPEPLLFKTINGPGAPIPPGLPNGIDAGAA